MGFLWFLGGLIVGAAVGWVGCALVTLAKIRE